MQNLSRPSTLLVPILAALSLVMMLVLMVAPTKAASDDTPIKIITFGDSLSAGYQLAQGQGFSDQLQKALDESGAKTKIVNAAVSGDTTSTGLARLDWSIPDDTDLVILELGANDALQGLPLDRTKANLEAMIKRLQERNIAILLAGMRAPPNMGPDYVGEFDAIYPKLAKSFNIPLYPFFLEGIAANPALNLKDGIHPNEQGIAVLVKNIAPYVLSIVKQLQD